MGFLLREPFAGDNTPAPEAMPGEAAADAAAAALPEGVGAEGAGRAIW